MWAVGCLISELYLGRAMFPGTSAINQLERVVAVTGPPSQAAIKAMRSDFAATMIGNLTYTERRGTVDTRLSMADKSVRDLVSKLLVFDPDQRLTVEEALNHECLIQFRNREPEDVSGPSIKLSLKDSKRYTVAEYRNKVYRDMLSKMAEERTARRERIMAAF
jgi:mitogen-activated protein kinase 15